MLVTFEEQYLEELYRTGKSRDKKHRYQPDVVRRYAKCVYRLQEAITLEDLWRYPSLRYEVLSGDKAGISSVRVNDQYRVEFIVRKAEEEPIITVCNILELSNHYK
ncbi:MAG: type II toxin-antitoxin system RelE/ParE family toxin [Rikenellaceae bacterium]|jgi:proteic killer suppression protein|nr:type II toxin-antitoxin system RelE/ParE family toxin [Rikenellaceae bacterium]